MKEQKSEIRLSTFIDTQPTTFPLTSRKTSFTSEEKPASPLSKHFTSVEQELNIPKILTNRYSNIYQQIYNDVRRISKHFFKQDEEAEKLMVKKGIQHVLKKQDEESDFNERFVVASSRRCKTSKSANKNAQIGSTNLEKEDLIKKTFFKNYKKVGNLQEQCMLVEYYLKDHEKGGVPVNYLTSIGGSSRHRRLTPSQKDNTRLHQTHNEQQYKSLKRRIHVKQQFVERCSKIAKNNCTYRRRQNFKKIEYIRKQNNKNMNEQTIVVDEADQHEKSKLLQNNRCWRLFLNFALLNENMKIYYSYIDRDGINKFKKALMTLNAILPTKEKLIDGHIASIVEYKSTKVLEFQDFRELLYFIQEVSDLNITSLFQKHFPDYFKRPVDLILKDKAQQIEKWAAFHKIKFTLRVIFNSQKEILIGLKILPTYGLTQKDLSMSKMFFYYRWVQHHNLGLTFQQFYEGSIMMAMRGQDWKSIDTLLKKININKLL